MRSIGKAILALARPVFLILSLLFAGSGAGDAAALPAVKPAIPCADLAKIDFTGLKGAPATRTFVQTAGQRSIGRPTTDRR